MPLNMNTVGTGTGSGIGGSSGRELVQSPNSSTLVTQAYANDIKSINFTTNGISYDAYEEWATQYIRTSVMYRGNLYAIGGPDINKPILYMYTLDYVDDTPIIHRTSIDTTGKLNLSTQFTSLVQLGEYLYFITNNYAYVTPKGFITIYRYDGSTFTEIFNRYDAFTEFFGAANMDYPYEYMRSSLLVYPICSASDDVRCVMELYGNYDNTNYYGCYSIFNVDDDGFHVIKAYTMRNISTYLVPYNDINTALMTSDDTYTVYIKNTGFIAEERMQINFSLTQESTNSNKLYTKSFTTLSSKTVVTDPKITTAKCDTRFVRVSYPTYDTYLLACMTKPQTSSTFANYKIGHWLQLKFANNIWNSSEISATVDNSTTTNIFNHPAQYFDIFVNTNTVKPYIWVRLSYYNSSIAIQNTFIEFKYIDWDAVYDSSDSRYVHQVYLEVGDIVYCDDGIISVRTGSNTTQVNAKTYKVTVAGDYEIITKVADAYTFPSFVITDKNGNIVYVRADKTSDTTINGYFLKGMKVNDSVVSSSTKQVYTNKHGRFKISMK